MKRLIMELPSLITPDLEETLFVYLAASHITVSRVLLAEREGKQRPIRYVSQTFHVFYTYHGGCGGQLLVDFLMEISTQANKEICKVADKEVATVVWTLYTDEASSGKGVSVELVLIDLTRLEYTYALRLNFESSNNAAKHEALLTSLRIAQKTKVQALVVKVDLKLVAKKINEEYVSCNKNMV
ncbi:reverse transcriptase domain-containing protein [Tanacetum coccineum]